MVRYHLIKNADQSFSFQENKLFDRTDVLLPEGVAISPQFTDMTDFRSMHNTILDFVHANFRGLPVVVQYPDAYAANNYRYSSKLNLEEEFGFPIEILVDYYNYNERFRGFILDDIRYHQGNYRYGFPIVASYLQSVNDSQVAFVPHPRINNDAVKIIVKMIQDIMEEKGLDKDKAAFLFSPLSRQPGASPIYKLSKFNFLFGGLALPALRDRIRRDDLVPLPNVSQRNIYSGTNINRFSGSSPGLFKMIAYIHDQPMFIVNKKSNPTVQFLFNPHLGKIRPKDMEWLKATFTKAIEALIVYEEKQAQIVVTNTQGNAYCSMNLIYDYNLDNLEEVKEKLVEAFRFLDSDTTSIRTSREKSYTVSTVPSSVLSNYFLRQYISSRIISNLGLRSNTSISLDNCNFEPGPLSIAHVNNRAVKVVSSYSTLWLIPFEEAKQYDARNIKMTAIEGGSILGKVVEAIQKDPKLLDYHRINYSMVGQFIGYGGDVDRRHALLSPLTKQLNILSPYNFGGDPAEDRVSIPTNRMPHGVKNLLLDRKSNALLGFNLQNGGDVLFVNLGSEQIMNQLPAILNKLQENDVSAYTRYQASYNFNRVNTVQSNGGSDEHRREATDIPYWTGQLKDAISSQLESGASESDLVDKLRILDTALKACGDGWKLRRTGGHIVLYLYLRNIWIKDGSESYFLGNYTAECTLTAVGADPKCHGGVYNTNNFPHPHVNSRVCMGTARDPYIRAVSTRNLVALHGLFRALLEVYNPGSPFIALPNFLHRTCNKCAGGGKARYWGGNFYCDNCYPSEVKSSVYWKNLPPELRIPMVYERI